MLSCSTCTAVILFVAAVAVAAVAVAAVVSLRFIIYLFVCLSAFLCFSIRLSTFIIYISHRHEYGQTNKEQMNKEQTNEQWTARRSAIT